MVSFLLAEFNAIVNRARDVDQINASRINFFLVIVAAIGAGLGGVADLSLPLNEYLWTAFVALLALIVLGLVTYYYSIEASIATVVLYRTAGRIRCWFADLAPEVVPYFPYVPADNLPDFTRPYWMFRGGEATVITINAIMASGLSGIILYQVSNRLWIALLVAIIVLPIAWLVQRWFYRKRMERAGDEYPTDWVRFPGKKYEDLFYGRVSVEKMTG